MRSLGVLVVVVALGASAAADTPTSTSEFERGRALQKDGKTAEACAAFGESLRLEFAYGTLFNVANCAELDGNLGTAWKAYHRLASEDSTSGRAAKAQAKADELWARVPKLVLTVAHAPPNTTYSVDGEPVVDGKPLPVDHGPHEVAARAPGYHDWHRTVTAGGEGSSTDIIIALEPTSTALPPPISSQRVERHRVGNHKLAWTFLIGGTALIASSIAISLYEKHVYDDAKSRIGSDPNAIDKANRAVAVNRYGATSLFVAGIVAIPIGVVVWKRSDVVVVTPVVTPDGGAVSIAGRF